ncbi:MAG: type II secretion system F family protein [Candidatus Scalindua rubra]|uniref:Type IV fimbrial assembly protein n=1 Tax=Candidatus Scalindua brodae TaxID=237368 RepID=A0A0B0EMX2_9BACT|nr:MAG: type IV fimbrial assembly protein [Candidatus Scalindua brodae]MBZ0109333.1 type II secretion system F family protein [Candidatus Scalindua rubra]TWU36761.1 Type II secretion system protein F [Candidatus Brocadiaceae bacterium S225]
MSVFKYEARDRFGKAVAGVLDAPEVGIARIRLGEMGYIPVRVEEGKVREKGLSISFLKQKVTDKDIIVFNRQLATLFSAGIPLLSGIQGLAEQMQNKTFKGILVKVAAEIQTGASFSDALAKHPKVFSGLYINMIKAGEASGTLDNILERLASLAEHAAETKAKIKAATRYPKIVVSAMLIAILILMKFVVPNFMSIFTQVDLELPLATRMLITANHIFTNYWYVLFGGTGCLFFAFKAYTKTYRGRRQLDLIKLKVPVFGPIFLKIAMSVFTRTMSTLNRSGLSILENLKICSEVVENIPISEVIVDLREGVQRGESVAATMKKSSFFTPMVIQMMSAGEESGELDNMLVKVSEYYDMEVDYSIKNIASLIEPILLAFLGAAVLFLMLAIFLPMWDLVKLAERGG